MNSVSRSNVRNVMFFPLRMRGTILLSLTAASPKAVSLMPCRALNASICFKRVAYLFMSRTLAVRKTSVNGIFPLDGCPVPWDVSVIRTGWPDRKDRDDGKRYWG